MAIRTYKVTLDSKNTIAPEPVFMRQGDKTGAVVIDATLMDNGTPVSLSGLTPMFKANTADGQSVIADSTGFTVTDSVNGKFTYQVPNALSAVPGKITTAYFSLSNSSGSESTFDVAFIIKKAVDITKPQADDYITIIDGTIQSLQQKIDAMNTDVQTIINAYNQGDFYNKSETDSKDSATLSSAKSYADSGDVATLSSAKSYTDSSLKGSESAMDTGWQTLTPSGVATSNPSYNPARWRRIWNRVYLDGQMVVSNNSQGVMAQLPYTPDSERGYLCYQAGSDVKNMLAGVYLHMNGQMELVGSMTIGRPIWLSGISYSTNDDWK